MDLIYGSDFYLIVDSLDLLESFRFLRTFGSFAFHKALILFHGSLDFACNILDLCIFLLRILQRIFNSFWIHLLFRGSFMDLIYGSDFYLIVDSLDLFESVRFCRSFNFWIFEFFHPLSFSNSLIFRITLPQYWQPLTKNVPP